MIGKSPTGTSGSGRSGAGTPFKLSEQRSGRDRRQGHERREEVRYEPAKADRRSGSDRRTHGGWDDVPIRR
ncbi:hypothetical protein ACFQZQ_09045 [Lysobacter koreensis]|uniref:Uncharacterized protein n=1 Tax=Lysobacter koreensis TaxID=266122 RepID=A0ABW2YMW6_9GAMM